MDFDDIIRLETKAKILPDWLLVHMKWAVKVEKKEKKKKKKENCWTCVKKYNRWHACLHYYYWFDCLLSVLYIMLWLQTWKIICMYTLFFSTPMQPHISGYLVVCLIYKFPLMRYIVFISTTIATPLFFLNLLNLFNLLLWSLFFWYSHCGANW